MTISGEMWQAVIVCFAAVFTGNILLTTFLGMCPFISVSREVKTAVGQHAEIVQRWVCAGVSLERSLKARLGRRVIVGRCGAHALIE